MSKWRLGVKVSYVVLSMAMIAAAYEYTDDLMAWVFSEMNRMIDGQMQSLLSGIL